MTTRFVRTAYGTRPVHHQAAHRCNPRPGHAGECTKATTKPLQRCYPGQAVRAQGDSNPQADGRPGGRAEHRQLVRVSKDGAFCSTTKAGGFIACTGEELTAAETNSRAGVQRVVQAIARFVVVIVTCLVIPWFCYDALLSTRQAAVQQKGHQNNQCYPVVQRFPTVSCRMRRGCNAGAAGPHVNHRDRPVHHGL